MISPLGISPDGDWNLEKWLGKRVFLKSMKKKGPDVKVERLFAIYAKEDKDDLVFLFFRKKNWWTLVLNDEAQAFERYPIDQLPENIFPQS